MSEAIDLERLTAPIDDGAGGVGEDPRLGADPSAFYAMKDLRTDARGAEREAASSPDSDVSVLEAGTRAWSELSDLAVEALANRCKDLELAAWLCEAQARLNGFTGLSESLDLILRLLETYWDAGLTPPEDEDGVESRIAPVAALLGLSGAAALVHPIRLIPLSDRDESVALWAVESAQAPIQGGDDPEARERAQTRRSERLEQIKQAIVRSSPDFLRKVYATIGATLETVNALVQAVDARAETGRFGSQVVEPLNAILALYDEHVGHLFRGDPAQTADAEGGAGFEGGGGGGGGGSGLAGPIVAGGRIGSREQAYDAILTIADFFSSNEPQSLVAKSLREVVRRARMPLDDLLTELIPDADQRTLFLLRAGVKDQSAAAVSESMY